MTLCRICDDDLLGVWGMALRWAAVLLTVKEDEEEDEYCEVLGTGGGVDGGVSDGNGSPILMPDAAAANDSRLSGDSLVGAALRIGLFLGEPCLLSMLPTNVAELVAELSIVGELGELWSALSVSLECECTGTCNIGSLSRAPVRPTRLWPPVRSAVVDSLSLRLASLSLSPEPLELSASSSEDGYQD